MQHITNYKGSNPTIANRDASLAKLYCLHLPPTMTPDGCLDRGIRGRLPNPMEYLEKYSKYVLTSSLQSQAIIPPYLMSATIIAVPRSE